MNIPNNEWKMTTLHLRILQNNSINPNLIFKWKKNKFLIKDITRTACLLPKNLEMVLCNFIEKVKNWDKIIKWLRRTCREKFVNAAELKTRTASFWTGKPMKVNFNLALFTHLQDKEESVLVGWWSNRRKSSLFLLLTLHLFSEK